MTLLAINLEDVSVQTFWSGLLGYAVYIIYLCIYRLYFHPLSRIPGPRLAAISIFHEAYYNLWQDGQHLFQTSQLHETHGPIVRISPNEVSIKDPTFYDKIHFVGSKFEKDPVFYSGFGAKHSMLTTQSNAVHTTRRAPFRQFFSRRNILTLESAVRETIDKLCSRIDKAIGEKRPFDILHGFKAMSVDVATGFIFGFSYGMLEREDLGRGFCEATEYRLASHWVAMYFPVMLVVLPRLPLWLMRVIQPGIHALVDLKMRVRDCIVRIKAAGVAAAPLGERETIYHHLLNPENSKDGGMFSEEHMVSEGVILVGAATDTVANALVATAFGVLSDPAIRARLQGELEEAYPDPNEELSFVKLETLPYLTAVIKEGLRKSPGVIGRVPRLVPSEGVNYAGYHLPEGTIVSMSSYYMHYDEAVFPDPMKFDPERWLGPTARLSERYLVPFGRGSRVCLGINLAYCEMFLTVGGIFRKYDMEIYNTSLEDITHVRDYFTGYPTKESRGFRVMAKSKDF